MTALCPRCQGPLQVEWRLTAAGPAHVAGVTPKVGAKDAPHLVCDVCGFVEAGKHKPVAP